jgi:asparagine synthase (glutamine-hydrolysing)
MGLLDAVPGLALSNIARGAYLRLNKVPHFTNTWRREVEDSVGGPNPWIDAYGLLAISKLRFYSESMREALAHTNPWNELDFPLKRAQRWDPLHRGVWIAARVLLAGHLLQAKGDRVAMHSSVEVRYPFLDEDVFDFLAKLHPRWRLRGFRDKYLLRLLAERWVPTSVARRHKVIFRAPLDSFYTDPEPPFVAQLLSEESLHTTGYFDSVSVNRWRNDFRKMRPSSLPRLSVEMGLMAVVATQLWHHLFMGGGLADLPDWSTIPTPAAEARA